MCQDYSRIVHQPDFEFGTTSKGHLMVICNGHKFIKNTYIPKNNADNRSYWTCTKYKSVFKCRARAIVVGKNTPCLILRFEHNHPAF